MDRPLHRARRRWASTRWPGWPRRYPPARTAALTGVPREQIVRTARLLGTETPTAHLAGPGGRAPRERRADGAGDRRARGAVPPRRTSRRFARTSPRCGPRPRPARCPPCPASRTARAGAAAGARARRRRRGASALRDVQPRGAGESARPGHPRGPALPGAGAGAGRLERAGDLAGERGAAPGRPSGSSCWSRWTRSSPPSGRRAHVVLPAATVRRGREGVVPPQHEAWPDWKVVFELARAMGLGSWFPWTSWAEAPSARHGCRCPPRRSSRRGSSRGRGRPAVGTPSGKIRARLGAPRQGRPRLRSRSGRRRPCSRTSEFPLMLVTGPRTRAYINSQFRQVARIRLLEPEPLVRVHPDRGAGRGAVARPAGGGGVARRPGGAPARGDHRRAAGRGGDAGRLGGGERQPRSSTGSGAIRSPASRRSARACAGSSPRRERRG